MNEVLPLDCFFIHPEKGIFSCSSSFIGDKPLPGILLMNLLKRCQRKYYSFPYSSLKPSTEFFQDFFFLWGQKNLLMF